MQHMHGCLKEEDGIILLNYCNILLIVNSCSIQSWQVTTTYLSFEKAKEVKSTLSSAPIIIQEANSAIVSKSIAKSRQMILHDFGMK